MEAGYRVQSNTSSASTFSCLDTDMMQVVHIVIARIFSPVKPQNIDSLRSHALIDCVDERAKREKGRGGSTSSS